MKFGVNTFIWSGMFDPKTIPLAAIRDHGIEGIEVPLFHTEGFDVAAILRAKKEFGFEVTACAANPPGINPTCEDPIGRAAGLEHWKGKIRAAAEAGVRMVAGPVYAPVGYLPGHRRTAAEWQWGVEFLQGLDAVLKECGVTLAVEPLNRFETYFLNTAEDSVRLAEAVGSPRVGILFDTFHANLEEKDVPAGYRRCGKHLVHVHACENDRGVPGTGHVDWPGVFAALAELNYDGWLMIESFNGNIPELAKATAIWRDLAPSLDDIAFQGTAFLKRMAAGG